MIKNVIFDLGVVLLDVDYEKTIDEFGFLGLENPREAFSKYRQDSFFKNFECGKMTDEEFLTGLSQRTGGAKPDKLRNAWCAMLGEFPSEKFKYLKDLSSKKRLFVLSNTNSIHQAWFERKIDEQYGWTNFIKNFEFIGYSHQIGERKPTRAAFETILTRFGLKSNETLFIDDTEEHVEGARKLNLHTLHYTKGENLQEKVESVLHSLSIFS